MFSKEHNAFKLAKIYTPGYKRERERQKWVRVKDRQWHDIKWECIEADKK